MKEIVLERNFVDIICSICPYFLFSFYPLIVQSWRVRDSSSFWSSFALHLSWTCFVVISCVHEKDLESIVEVVLLASCMVFTYIYTTHQGFI